MDNNWLPAEITGIRNAPIWAQFQTQSLAKMLKVGTAPRWMPKKLKFTPCRVASLRAGMASFSCWAYCGIKEAAAICS